MVERINSMIHAHLLALLFSGFACGVVAAAHGAATASAVAIALAAACGITANWCADRAIRRAIAFFAYATIVGVSSGTLALRNEARIPYASLNDRHVIVAAVGLERPHAAATGVEFRARIDRVLSPRSPSAQSLRGETALVQVAGGAAGAAGRLLGIRARLELPHGARNEGERPERESLADEGVSVILVVHRAGDLAVFGAAPGWSAWWARARAGCAGAVESRLPALQATVLEGILWGDRGNLPMDLRQEFSDTGTVHVLTTAGLHVGMMAAMLAGLLSCLPLPRAVRSGAVVAAVWSYAQLAGFHLPTVRAATMLSVGIVASQTGRARSPSAILASAALAVCLPHPLALLSPSFAMSFACVGGIALLGPALSALGLNRSLGVPHLGVEVLRTSVAVQLAMWPMQALYFNAFTPYAVIANMLVVPLVGIVMAAGSALVVLSAWLPALGAPVANLVSWLLAVLVGIVERTAQLPFAHIDVPPPNVAFLVLYWLALGALAWGASRIVRRWRLCAAAAVATALLGAVYLAPGVAAALDPRLHVDAIDVGQADCILVRAPGMRAMLVDGGGRLERGGSSAVVAQPIGDRIATRVVLPFLLRHWVLHLDAVVLTHPHGDHVGGMPVILTRERVDRVYDSAQLYAGPAYQRALEVMRERHIRWIRAQRGAAFDLGPDARVQVLAPELPLITGSSSDINNNSVVLRLTFRRVAILLTGDAQAEAEARLLSHGGADLRADILKVGHHGSAYSSTPQFLAAVRPKIAVISCGLHNVFGHPSPRTLDALREAGARTYRTDLDGGISIATDGASIQAERTVKRPAGAP